MSSIEHVYEPRGAAKELFTCLDPEVVMSGPVGTGKSRACLEVILALCLAYPGTKALMVRKVGADLPSTAIETWEKWVAKEFLENSVIVHHGARANRPAQYEFANGSTLAYGGLDRATKLLSAEYDIAYVMQAEEVSEDSWEKLTSRLRNNNIPRQQLIADCNPDAPTHWLKQRSLSGLTTMLQSRHKDNPWLYDSGQWTKQGAAYMEKIDRLTGVRRLRLREGKWAAAEGQIYEAWDDSTHIKAIDISPSWTRYWTIDFGFTNPMVVQHWAIDDDGRAILYREFVKTQTLVEDMATMVLDTVAPGGDWIEPKPRYVICDHDAEGRATWERHTKMRTIPAKKAVTAGIQEMAERLKLVNGTPRLMVTPNALVTTDAEMREAKLPMGLSEEIPGYVWDAKKERPVKEDDHSMDAARYLASFLAKPRRRRRARQLSYV